MKKIAIIRIRGQVRNNGRRHMTLELMKMQKKFSTLIAEDTKILRMKLNMLAPDITWGEADEETIQMLEKAHQEHKVYNLNSPKGGLGRKGIKMPYARKGAYGYRGSRINELIKKMI